jgi:hypothetical protein
MALVNPGEPVEAAIELIVVQSQGRERRTANNLVAGSTAASFFDNLYTFSAQPTTLCDTVKERLLGVEG